MELTFDQRVRSYYPDGRLLIMFVLPGEEAFKSVNDSGAGAIKKGAKHNIVFTNVKDLKFFYGCEHNIITIFVGFKNWSSVVQQIYFHHKLIISGVDSSKRHCINQLQANFFTHLTFLTGGYLLELPDKGIVYNLPKYIINPKIDLNKFNTLLDKPKHNSNIKALKRFDELYSGLISQYSNF